MASRDIVGRRTKELWARDLHKLIKGLGRCVTIYRPDLESDCPNCFYDAINRESTGKYDSSNPNPVGSLHRPFTVGRCPVCRGRGTLTTKRKKDIHALVTWRPRPEGMMGNDTQFTPAGKASDTVVRIKTDPCHLVLIRESKFAMIDGLKCVLSDPPTIRGLGNRKVLIALFKVEDKFKPGEKV
jgi:hypothetical protein